MILLTAADLKRKHKPFPEHAYREFSSRIGAGIPEYQHYDVAVMALGLSPKLLFLVLRELEDCDLRCLPVGGELSSSYCRQLQSRSQALIIAVPGPAKPDPETAWFIGQFDALSGGRIALLPVFAKDIATEHYSCPGLLSRYPYIGFARAMGEDRDNAWVMKSTGDYVNIEYWMGLGSGLM